MDTGKPRGRRAGHLASGKSRRLWMERDGAAGGGLLVHRSPEPWERASPWISQDASLPFGDLATMLLNGVNGCPGRGRVLSDALAGHWRVLQRQSA